MINQQDKPNQLNILDEFHLTFIINLYSSIWAIHLQIIEQYYYQIDNNLSQEQKNLALIIIQWVSVKSILIIMVIHLMNQLYFYQLIQINFIRQFIMSLLLLKYSYYLVNYLVPRCCLAQFTFFMAILIH
ncbi:transmembrane protein, putative (macronuclear) [Tetrahymena thermophila SB210]|uniref:Transmembrane protein, putative n=1 Tax=Tetrahymena thermophila (strain SB210) TaxID=312017 RepID=W7X175_TETTS|nr:transmembrane protein, putative [Tetrahymena thermophila SB210]EWS72965.1 transmembrane protein, putative [Tetrahymena thermophila SB210]|eukprot:XP_012654498.1 transmembrane protein, putative [Tetrahymena thermophila SB210]